jgi:hypothetical protein
MGIFLLAGGLAADDWNHTQRLPDAAELDLGTSVFTFT